jgi:hypothetical protein
VADEAMLKVLGPILALFEHTQSVVQASPWQGVQLRLSRCHRDRGGKNVFAKWQAAYFERWSQMETAKMDRTDTLGETGERELNSGRERD